MSFVVSLQLSRKFFTSFEAGNFAGFDFDNFTSLRVASVTGSTLGNRKSSETYQGNFSATFQCFCYGFYK